MQTNRLAQTALIVLVAGGIIAGLLTVGGPAQGRKERHDADRLSDIERLASHVTCLAENNRKTLPETMAPSTICNPDSRLRDPYTDEPYRYEKLSEVSYRICARFEAPDHIPYYRADNFNSETGCVTHSYKP